jgi:hypothetical protein
VTVFDVDRLIAFQAIELRLRDALTLVWLHGLSTSANTLVGRPKTDRGQLGLALAGCR